MSDARAVECPMAWLPAKARKALIVGTILLVVSKMVTGKAECFFCLGEASRQMIEFLEEFKTSELVDSRDQVCFLLSSDIICGNDGV